MRKLIYTISIFGAVGASFFFGHAVLAARFDLSPSTTQFIEGCDSAVDISINTGSDVSDAANILLHYNPAEIDIVDSDAGAPGTQIRPGSAYEAYVDNTVVPAEGLIRLTGFSFARRVSGTATFGTVIFRGRSGVTATTMTVEYVPGSTTDSNIAEYLTSDDLLTGVTNGSYTFRTGSCIADTTPPWVTNASPAPGASGVPLDANITFNINDNRSGVDLDSVRVNVDGTIYTLAGPNFFTNTGSALNYAVTVNPIADFGAGLPVLVEINGMDLEGNRMAPYRYTFNQPVVPPPPPPSCESLGCANPTTCVQVTDLPEIIDEEQTVPESQELSLTDIAFYVAGGTLRVFPDDKGTITSLTGEELSLVVSIAQSKFPRDVENVILTIANSSYFLTANPETGAFQAIIQPPRAAGSYPLNISILYKDGAYDQVQGMLLLKVPGVIWEGTPENRIIGAKVTLFEEYASFRVWNGSPYNQSNPLLTDDRGEFSFLVPPDRYYLLIQKDGYRDVTTPVFSVTDNLVNPSIEMLVKPPTLAEVWDADATLPENLGNVAKNLGQKTIYGGQVFQKDVLDNPAVEGANEGFVTPAVAAVALLNYGTAISLAGLLPYLQLIFTQPILLLFPKRRKGWGVVYHSLTKMPVDLAIVRLYDKVTGRLVQTRVTDHDGRFAFFVHPGNYFIKVTKPNFSFPTAYLKDKEEDIKYLDIYHGEEIQVTEKNALVTPNIPVDPMEAEKARVDRRAITTYFARKIQDLAAVLGIVLASVSVVISPKLWMVGVLVAHCLLYILFKRLARPRRPKSWGIVYERTSRAPVGLTVARIFETEYNKLLETQVTDGHGRYSFLVGNNSYYVTFSKPGFEPKKTEVIDLKKAGSEAAVGLDVALEKAV